MAFRVNLRRLGAGAAALAFIAGASIAGASSASAAPGQQACVNGLGIGYMCVDERDNGYDAEWNSVISDKVDFTLWITKGPVGDAGAFNAQAFENYSYFFATGYQSVAHLCLYSRDNQFSPLCTPNLNN